MTRSRRCTAWGIAIRKSEKTARDVYGGVRPKRSLLLSPIARVILLSNLAGLLILVTGALLLNELRSNLVYARQASLSEQADIISSTLTDYARGPEDEAPRLDDAKVRFYLKRAALSDNSRVRVFNMNGDPIADTALLSDEIEGAQLPPIKVKEPGPLATAWLNIVREVNSSFERLTLRRDAVNEAITLEEEVQTALAGKASFSQRFDDNAERVLSMTVPIKIVGAVVGTLTLESSDVAEIIAAERAALIPLILVAILVAVITSTLLTLAIARPLRRLALASDRVRTGATERLNLGSLHDRKDEIGDLARAMEAMTATLYDRIQSNERFAADVAHELKNPLTSIRSAVETSQAVNDPAVRERMSKVIAKDVIRLDRLISDISNLSRLEGEIVREKPTRVDLVRILEDIVSIYRDTSRENEAKITLNITGVDGRGVVMGREGPLGQVIRNLVENARSFSPPEREVTVTLTRTASPTLGPALRMTVEDQGPGVPPDKLEKIFERFYTDRPQGAKFGNNSGLGLSIVRQIVETHRGRVWAENRESDGKVTGARFVVELPAAPVES